ncbi:Uncharacterised protein [Streptococcus pneumoniae]|nr:Uncharacterised protein [Streptococcus pneumoniae]
MCEKIRIRRISDYPSARGGLEDILIMENMTIISFWFKSECMAICLILLVLKGKGKSIIV